MRFTDEVAVPADPEAVFATLADVGRAAGCLPGAWVDGRDGGRESGAHTGGLRVRLGPVRPVYRGTVRVLEADRSRRRLVLAARGRDDEGSGPAAARLEVAVLPAAGGSSLLRLDADLVVRGRVARGGHGVLAEVSHALAGRFAEQLGVLANAEPPDPAPHVSEIPGYGREFRSRRGRTGAVVAGAGALVVAVTAAVAVWRGRLHDRVWPG